MDNKDKLLTVSDVLQKADIALDSYDDIFSDFDPSPYESRLLSEDFLYELNRRYAATPKGQFSVNFTLPGHLRSEKIESLIKKRIKDHFRARMKKTEIRAHGHARTGAIRVGAGIVLSIAVFLVPQLETVPLVTIFSVLIWYAIWSGIESISEASVHLGRRRALAEKFLRSEYSFISQEDVLESMRRLQAAENLQKADAQRDGSA